MNPRAGESLLPTRWHFLSVLMFEGTEAAAITRRVRHKEAGAAIDEYELFPRMISFTKSPCG